MRELATELAMKTRLPLGDFDVLAQLALLAGSCRMTELAAKAFSSRSEPGSMRPPSYMGGRTTSPRIAS